MKTKVCVAGITGWVGRPLADALGATDDLKLVGGVSRSGAGTSIHGTSVYGSVSEAMADTSVDVLVDYTSADVVKADAMTALAGGAHVVIGSSGLTDDDFAAIDSAARQHGLGVIAAGNFAVTAVLLKRFACEAAKFISEFEIIDYFKSTKPDAPSGTAREIANAISQVRQPALPVAIEDTVGEAESRGATLNGIQAHSVRLPGFVSSIEVLFGSTGERLSLRHDSTESPEPYIHGTLLAIRKVKDQVGVVRGLDKIMDLK